MASSSSSPDPGTAGTTARTCPVHTGVTTTSNEATAPTGPIVNKNGAIVEAIREAVNSYVEDKKANCADGEDWKKVSGARTRDLNEEESARFTKAFDENMKASEDLNAESEPESTDALCALAAELCGKEPEACCKKTVEEAKDASSSTKATDEAVTTAVDGAAEAEIQGTLSSQTLLPASVAWWKKRESIVDFAANYGNNQAGNEATASPAVEEEDEAKDLPPAYVEEKSVEAVEAVSGEIVAVSGELQVVDAIQKIEDLAINEEEDKSVKEVPASDGKLVIISPFGDVVPWDDFIEFINMLVTEFADSDINFPFKFEEVKQVTETTGGAPVEVEKTEKVSSSPLSLQEYISIYAKY